MRTGRFRFGPLSVVTKADGEVPHLWSARDALVLKALALVVGPQLGLSPRCVHVKGHGGLKAAVREVQQRLPDYGHVLRTDVKGFYESIDQSILLAQLAAQIDDPLVLEPARPGDPAHGGARRLVLGHPHRHLARLSVEPDCSGPCI